jgi:hypothetical protein
MFATICVGGGCIRQVSLLENNLVERELTLQKRLDKII